MRTAREWMQVSEHAVECAIKAYLCAVRSKVPKEHDIVKLVMSRWLPAYQSANEISQRSFM
jgi:hypothetical protein